MNAMNNVTFKKGQKVRDIFGKLHVVRSQPNDVQVFVVGSSAWFHPSKLFAV